MKFFYLIGQPGAGKTTLLAEMTRGLPYMMAPNPFAHIIWQGETEVVELGPKREAFSGTDGLSMSVQPKVLDWLALKMYDSYFAEGDRLSTGSFFDGVEALGYDLQVAYLNTPTELAHARRTSRSERLGVPPQSSSWVAGRVTKVDRLAHDWATLELDGSLPIADLADILRQQSVFTDLLGG